MHQTCNICKQNLASMFLFFESCGWCRIHRQDVWHNLRREGKYSIGCIGCIGSFLRLPDGGVSPARPAQSRLAAQPSAAESVLRHGHAPAPPCCAEAGKNPQDLAVNALVPVRQHGNRMSRKQFSVTRAASANRRGVKKEIPVRPHAPGASPRGMKISLLISGGLRLFSGQ
jgi:hypothetical protein